MYKKEQNASQGPPVCNGPSLHDPAVKADAAACWRCAETDSSGSHVTIDTVAHDAALDSGPEPVSCLAYSLQPPMPT